MSVLKGCSQQIRSHLDLWLPSVALTWMLRAWAPFANQLRDFEQCHGGEIMYRPPGRSATCCFAPVIHLRLPSL